jgi:hypothetical protein
VGQIFEIKTEWQFLSVKIGNYWTQYGFSNNRILKGETVLSVKTTNFASFKQKPPPNYFYTKTH